MTLADLETPALLVDLDIMERNLQRAADYARGHGLKLRPHIKTHKTPALARRQLALGACGITAAKVGEAEVMLEAEPPEVLVAYPVLGSAKLARLMEVARHTRVLVALDSREAAEGLSHAATAAGLRVGVLTEADLGLHRVGVPPGEPLLALIRQVRQLPGLEWRGLTFYPGHIKSLDEAGRAARHTLSEDVGLMLAEVRRAGCEPEIVSGGSTPALYFSHEVAGLTEIRPGTYIFNDRNTWVMGACAPADCAATILCTVVSTAVPGQMILDGGSKTFSSDRLVTGGEGFGYIVEAPEARFLKMNEEHGFVELGAGAGRFRVGDRVHVLMNHVCVAVNLHERIYGMRGQLVEEVWKVEARGKLQ